MSFYTTLKLNQQPLNELKVILNQMVTSADQRPVLENIFMPLKNSLKNGYRAVMLQVEADNKQFFSIQELRKINMIISELLGDALVQNEQGDKTILVYDRDRLGSMTTGARYHQTREGGSIHTDNVNVPQKWDYLLLSCLAPSMVGGENIFVDGVAIHQILKEQFPLALKVLEQDFIWEMRGVADELYNAPIITYDQAGSPHFRHLRPYMESAHQKAQTPLTKEQLYAIDVLDALTNSTENQVRYLMQRGDILISKDDQVLHGRTCFSDHIEAVSLEELTKNGEGIPKRTMERLWIKQ